MATVPQEIVDMIIGFLVEDRASLLTCSLAGNSFYSPSRAHLFAEIEVNSLPRFRGLLELSTTSPTIFDDASLQPFSFVRTISVRDADAWITPEILPSLLSLPFLPQFTNIRDFRIDGLTLLAEVTPMESILPRSGPRVGIDVGRGFGAFRGVPAEESIADSLDFLSRHGSSTASLGALSLENCRVPSLGWFLRYVSRFPNLKSLSLIDFTWQSVDGTHTDQGPAFRCPQATPQQQRGMLELTLKNQYNPLIACAPRLLFESLSRRLRILQMMHIDAFLSVDADEGSIYLDPSYIALSPLNYLTHLTLPPVAVWLQAKQRWLPDLLSTITSTSNLKELNIHLLFSPVAIKAQLDSVVWSTVDLILGRKLGEELAYGVKNGVRIGPRGGSEGCVFTVLEVVRITSADFNPERPPLGGDTKSRIKEWLIGYMPRAYERRILQVPLED